MRSFTTRFPVVALALPAVLALAPVLADETPLAKIEHGIKGFEIQIKNASMRLQYVSEPSAAESSSALKKASDKPTPLFLRCCTHNVDVMKDRYATIRGSLRELYDRHTAANDTEALDALSAVAVSLEDVGGNLKRLDHAGDHTFGRAALKTLGASVRDLSNRVSVYADCCGPDAKKRRKKKNKRVQGEGS